MNRLNTPRTLPSTLRRAAALAGLAALLCAAQVQAQAIQKCRIDGRLVFQSSPCPLDAPAQAGLAPQLSVATSAATGAPKKKTLAELLRERDGADRRPVVHDAQSDGAKILPARMGAV